MGTVKVQLSREEIFNRLSDVLVEGLGVKKEEIQLESSLIDDLGADSMDRYEILMKIEDEFKTAFDDEEIQNADKIKDIIDSIFNKLN